MDCHFVAVASGKFAVLLVAAEFAIHQFFICRQLQVLWTNVLVKGLLTRAVLEAIVLIFVLIYPVADEGFLAAEAAG